MSSTPRPGPPLQVHSGGPPGGGPAAPLGRAGALPFELGGVLGRGGMGEVRSAWDPRLRRDVALKTVRPGDALSAARLAREAQLTARLEHPGIVPVYEAGRGDDGRPWYAMRLFTGRSLGERIAASPTLDGRLRLVRHVIDAAQAVAYAHGQGIVHRDVKPANVLTGSFGETIVADWGLACTLQEAAASESVGTPGYMSPEQAAGRPVDGRTDVYALGGVLLEVLTGQAPEPGDPLRPVRADSSLPPELVAIAEKALRADPAGRYPTAQAFADDLLAWFEGRRVHAHEYSTTELLLRLVQRWRVPLQVAGVGLLAVGAAVAVGWVQTAAEHARAEAMAAEAAQAREDERVAFAAALRVQAATAASQGLDMEAELLALHALRRHDTAEARGMLAAVYGRERWAATGGAQLQGCRRVFLHPSGTPVLCVRLAEAAIVDTTGRELARAPGHWRRGIFDPGGTRLILVDDDQRVWRWDWPREPVQTVAHAAATATSPPSGMPGRVVTNTSGNEQVIDLDSGEVVVTQSCPPSGAAHATNLTAAGQLLVGCRNGEVVLRQGDRVRTLLTLSADEGLPTLVQEVRPGLAAVGTTRGWVLLVGLDGTPGLRRRLGEDSVYTLAWRAGRALVGISDGDAVVWDTDTDVVAFRLRHQGLSATWLDDEHFRLVGHAVQDRAAPRQTHPHRLVADTGVTALAWSADGEGLVVTQGNGQALIFDPRTGARRGQVFGAAGVAKDVTFAPDGTAFAVTSAAGEQAVYDWPALTERRRLQFQNARRVAWLRQAGLLVAPYKPELWSMPLQDGAPMVKLSEPGFQDLEGNAEGNAVAGVDDEGGVWLGTDGPTPSWRRLAQARDSTGVTLAGTNVFMGDATTIRRVHPDGEVTWKAALPGNVTDLAASPDGRWLAAGTLDGGVMVWAVGEPEPRARITRHRARVAALAFSADSRWLASGSWDGEVRTWAVEALSAEAEPLVAEAEAAWGVDLDAVLSPEVVTDGR